jgi:ABC-type multidrug transport system ATPase subunit
MGLLAGLLQKQQGEVDILGQGPFSAKVHAGKVSLMPQDCSPSSHLPIRDVLQYYARLQGVAATRVGSEVKRCLDQVELSTRADSRYGQLSHGMRRRFGIAQALLGEPELVMLDEPTSGLDPELVVRVRELLAAQRGKLTLLVSSHILSELEALCDYVVFIDHGRCVRQGSMKEVTNASSTVRYTLSTTPDLDQLGLALLGCTLEWAEPVLSVAAPRSQSVEQTNSLCLRALLDGGAGIVEVEVGESLEATYLRSRRLAVSEPAAPANDFDK